MGICHDLNVDLHTHSSASDGVLSPENLVKRAANNIVDILALTDHDSVAGISEALEVSRSTDLHFIPGVEISVSWGGACIHLVGLDVDHENTEFLGALLGIQTGRLERAKRIDESLQKEGLPSLLTAALDFSKNSGQVGRTHFARALTERGFCDSIQEVFSNYLVKGKPGYVEHLWPSLKDAMHWISQAGGTAVIAHPARYKTLGGHLSYLLEEFLSLGGSAIEVATGSHSSVDIRRFQSIANEVGFDASRGSDFHCPNESRCDVGQAPNLPDGTMPIWNKWVGELI